MCIATQTSALVGYYSNLAASGNDPAAPKYRRISRLGSVDEIKQRVFDCTEFVAY